jgi:hypothetical protein
MDFRKPLRYTGQITINFILIITFGQSKKVNMSVCINTKVERASAGKVLTHPYPDTGPNLHRKMLTLERASETRINTFHIPCCVFYFLHNPLGFWRGGKCLVSNMTGS